MIKNVGIGIAPKVIETNLPEPEQTNVTPQSEVTETQNLPQIKPGNTSIVAEYQMSTIALQAQLQNQLRQSELIKQPAPAKVMQNESASSLLNTQEVSLRSEFTSNPDQWKLESNPTLTKFPGRKEAGNWAALAQSLSTGSGDDRVDIQMGSDGRVHVNVNGKEAWSGTTKQFQALTIDTGAGNDVVNNTVNGAMIRTGEGNDEVRNKANNALIDTGHGDDKVVSEGFRNEISTGDGHDAVENSGDWNSIATGSGNDLITSRGDSNSIISGEGGDLVRSDGDDNRINSGGGDDIVQIEGGNNTVRTEDGNDDVSVSHAFDDDNPYQPTFSSGNYIDTGQGADIVKNETWSSQIRTGEGDDYVVNHGMDTSMNTGDGDDYVVNSGRNSFVTTEAGNDLVEIKGGSGTRVNTGEGSDVVQISGNKNPENPGYWDRTVDPIDVKTGDDGDQVINTDGSKVIVNGPY